MSASIAIGKVLQKASPTSLTIAEKAKSWSAHIKRIRLVDFIFGMMRLLISPPLIGHHSCDQIGFGYWLNHDATMPAWIMVSHNSQFGRAAGGGGRRQRPAAAAACGGGRRPAAAAGGRRPGGRAAMGLVIATRFGFG